MARGEVDSLYECVKQVYNNFFVFSVIITQSEAPSMLLYTRTICEISSVFRSHGHR